jgi:diaminobutyrate-2-oxoglutarate transaminase
MDSIADAMSQTIESGVRFYSRSFPTVFTSAEGYRIVDEAGRSYIDFFSGAGALNYGHNNPRIKRQVIEYLQGNGILHSLDMATTAKRAFLARFDEVILRPRGLEYKVQFTGPTGTNAVEAALKLARKVTGRQNVVFFTHAYHGCTLGSLAVTANAAKRAAAGVPLLGGIPVPFDGFPGRPDNSLRYLEALLEDPGAGMDLPAAIIVETVQAEGGINVASAAWLRRLEVLARRFGVMLIVDDIQVGCGRTGSFFSFEEAGIKPDLICLSKSISGLGLPMAIVLIRPELDLWQPGEHTGTFRGLNLAFVAGTEALTYWEDDALSRDIERKSALVRRRLEGLLGECSEAAGAYRGRGLIQGIAFKQQGLASQVARAAFDAGLIIETAGPDDRVLKLLPPLVIEDEGLTAGLDIIAACLREVLAKTAVLGVA